MSRIIKLKTLGGSLSKYSTFLEVELNSRAEVTEVRN